MKKSLESCGLEFELSQDAESDDLELTRIVDPEVAFQELASCLGSWIAKDRERTRLKALAQSTAGVNQYRQEGAAAVVNELLNLLNEFPQATITAATVAAAFDKMKEKYPVEAI